VIRARAAALNWREDAIVALFAVSDGAIVWLAIAALLRARNPERHVVAPLAIAVGVLLANFLPRLIVQRKLRWEVGYGLAAAGFVVTIAIWVKSGAFAEVSWLDPSWLGDLVDGFAIKGQGVGEVVWLSVFGAAFAWQAGTTRLNVDVQMANDQLRKGAIACIAVLALNAALTGGVASGPASLAAIVFFAASLTAISLARAAANLAGIDVGRTSSPTVIAGPAATVVGVSLIAGAIISHQLLDTLIWLLGFPVGWIWFVVRYLLLALAFVFFIVMYPIFWLLNKLPAPSMPAQPAATPPSQPLGPLTTPAQSSATVMPDWVRYAVAGVVLLLICLVVLRITAKRRQVEQLDEDEVRERLPDDEAGSLLGDLWSRFRNRGAAEDPLADLRGDPRWAHTVAIREAFERFLEWSRDHGVPRRPPATAPEHVASVEAAVPVPAQEAERLLASYRAIRYRATPATKEEAEAALDAWRRLHSQTAEGE
jgi:hypothetical protein